MGYTKSNMRRQSRNKVSFGTQGRTKKSVLGLTGSFGTGKTTVAKMFGSLGAGIIDADRIAHQVIQPGTKVYRRIIKIFGKDILKRNKTINRDKLARTVFNHKNSLSKLNKIMHPEIIRAMKKKIKATRAKVIVLDAPLLIEAGLSNTVDSLLVVKINRKQQIERLLRKMHLAQNEILKRVKAQIPLAKKVRLADFVIDNCGTLTATRKQVKKIWERILYPRKKGSFARRMKWKRQKN